MPYLIFYCVLTIVTILFLLPVPEQAGSLINDKLMHVGVFFGLSWLINRTYSQHGFMPRLALTMLCYGLSIEILQGLSGYRMFSAFDLLANAIGIGLFGLSQRVCRRH